MASEVWNQFAFLSARDVPIEGMASHISHPFFEEAGEDCFNCYFSYRDAENRAHGGCATVKLSDEGVEVLDAREILQLGEAGFYDQHGIVLTSLVKVGAARYLYYSGRTQGEEKPMLYSSIGLAIFQENSKDFVKYSSVPIFAINRHNPRFIAGPCVVPHGNNFLMAYSSCYDWKRINGNLESYYDIWLARSNDGLAWVPDQPVHLEKKPGEQQFGRPWLVVGKDGWRLWYSYAGEHKYRTGFATSKDLISWERHDNSVEFHFQDSEHFSEMQCYPSTFHWRGKEILAMNGNNYGKEGLGLFEKA